MHKQGADVLVVSSGAIALGRTVLGLPNRDLKLEDSQAAAAIGQIALARIWAEVLADRKITAGQILVTLGDTEERQRYLNARATIGRLLDLRAVPVINENDTVATNEIRYGDNDRLAARVATMASADLLILLSDVQGLYTAPPAETPRPQLIPVVPRVDAAIEAMAGGAASRLSRGGMRTKIEAAKIATAAGTHMIITDGRVEHPVSRLNDGAACTWFLTGSNPVTARKKWIAGSLEPRGALHVDAGAAQAIANGKSLLPAGVTRVEGNFTSGDCVLIRDFRAVEIGRGLVAYDVERRGLDRRAQFAGYCNFARFTRARGDHPPGRYGPRARPDCRMGAGCGWEILRRSRTACGRPRPRNSWRTLAGLPVPPRMPCRWHRQSRKTWRSARPLKRSARAPPTFSRPMRATWQPPRQMARRAPFSTGWCSMRPASRRWPRASRPSPPFPIRSGACSRRFERPNGLLIERVATPLGVIGVIYESRPAVTADAGALCLKAGNAAILRGGSESFLSSRSIHDCLVAGLDAAGLPNGRDQRVPVTDRAAVGEMLSGLDGNLDVIVPRGGKSLVARVQAEARVPVFAHLEGIVHVFIDRDADLEKAEAIVLNAKLRRTGICGAAETLLVDRACAATHLGAARQNAARCWLRGARRCETHGRGRAGDAGERRRLEHRISRSRSLPCGSSTASTRPSPISRPIGSHHTDCIVTENQAAAERFLNEVDSAIVLHNASTQFADGGEFGFGAEIGIATGRMHARGPVGLEQLTSFKYRVHGNGQICP